VLLECLINAYHEGLGAEEIAFQYPTLTLEQIHGAIAFYLGNREEMDQYMRKLDEKWEQFRREAAEPNAELRRRIQVVRQAENHR
jgi:hypothetical protein